MQDFDDDFSDLFEEKGYPCTFIVGERSSVANITFINQEDVDWFKEHNAKLTGETLSNGQYAFYADVGVLEDDGETPMEAIVLANHGTADPYATFALLRKRSQELLNEMEFINES